MEYLETLFKIKVEVEWISTGDDDHEAALYVTDPEFSRLEKVLYGSQQTRTIKLLFTEQYIYFGSDAPHEVNYLYRMNKSIHKTERLARVGSSVFHGTVLTRSTRGCFNTEYTVNF